MVGMSSLVATPLLSASAVTRYTLPNTDYFNRFEGMSLQQLAGYSHAERLAHLIGNNLEVRMRVPLQGPLEYSPFGAGLVERMREVPAMADLFTGRWSQALVASPATAILGLGAAPLNKSLVRRTEIAKPIMDGKAKYFLWTAGVSATANCLDPTLSEGQLNEINRMLLLGEEKLAYEKLRVLHAMDFANKVIGMANNYGFVNVEDARGGDLTLILGALKCLEGRCAVWSDDQQGTGVITAAAMLSWADLTDRQLKDVRVVLMGAGAGAMGVYDEMVNHGVLPENILVTDSRGVLHEGRTDIEGDPYKMKMRQGIPEGTQLKKFAQGADGLINLGVKESLTSDRDATAQLIRNLAGRPFVAPMTNPDPGITPRILEQIRKDAFYGSGNQRYINPVNNFTAFGYIGAGALESRAGAVNSAMTVAAARAIHKVTQLGPPDWLRGRLSSEQQEYGAHWLVPHPEDIRLIPAEAGAVARAAARSGVSKFFQDQATAEELELFDQMIASQMEARADYVEELRKEAKKNAPVYYRRHFPDRYAPVTLPENEEADFEVSPEVGVDDFFLLVQEMGIKESHIQNLLIEAGQLKPTAVSEALNDLGKQLHEQAQRMPEVEKRWREEWQIIVNITQVYPALGLALAICRRRLNLASHPTVFHDPELAEVVLKYIPEARSAIDELGRVANAA